MRAFWIVGCVTCLLATSAAPALADDRELAWAIKKTPLRARPGESSPVIDHADAGDELEVLANRGRWLRVRLGRRVGWVTRTQVEDAEPAPKSSKRAKVVKGAKGAKGAKIEKVAKAAQAATASDAAVAKAGDAAAADEEPAPKSGFSGRRVEDTLKVKVAIDGVRGFDDPRTKKQSVLQLVRGDIVTVIGRGHEGWILVQHEQGSIGWIPASAVDDAGRFTGDPRRTPAELAKVAKVDAAPASDAPASVAAKATALSRTPPRKLVATVIATGGAQTFQMKQAETRSVGTGMIGTVAGGAHYRVRGDLWVGVAAAAEMGSADLTYYAGAEASAKMPSKELVVDGSGEVRYGAGRYVAARAGVHYAKFSVETDRTEPMLIGERVGGLTVGLAGGWPLGRRFAVSGAIDVMPAGSQQMTDLPPGTLYATAVRGGWARSTVTMQLPSHLVAAVSYRGGLVSSTLTDGAETPKSGTRTDQSHAVMAGVGMSW